MEKVNIKIDIQKLNKVLFANLSKIKFKTVSDDYINSDEVELILSAYLYRNLLLTDTFFSLIKDNEGLKAGNLFNIMALFRNNLENFYKFMWIMKSGNSDVENNRAKRAYLADHLSEVKNLLSKKKHLAKVNIALRKQDCDRLASLASSCKEYNDVHKLVDPFDALNDLNISDIMRKLGINLANILGEIKFDNKYGLENLKLSIYNHYNELSEYAHPNLKNTFLFLNLTRKGEWDHLLFMRDINFISSINCTLAMAFSLFEKCNLELSRDDNEYLNKFQVDIENELERHEKGL
ncbi:MAG: DUF5677 domain-containing protein [Candidatus Odinarchaeota archaeon]